MRSTLAPGQLAELLEAHPLFRGRGVDCLRLIERCRVVFLDPDELLYCAGTRAECVFVVLTGALQIEYPTGADVTRGYVVTILVAPAFLGESQALHQLNWSGTGVAITPLTAVCVGREDLERTMLEAPAFAVCLYRELAQRFLLAIETRKADLQLSPAQSIARYLHGVTGARLWAGLRGDPLEIRQVDIARATGLRRETVNRVLRDWTMAGDVRVTRTGLAGLTVERLVELANGATFI